jgi:hypothetical protein
MAKKRIDVEPTAEDFERVDYNVKHGGDKLRYILAKRYAQERAWREYQERRRQSLFRRILRFGRA